MSILESIKRGCRRFKVIKVITTTKVSRSEEERKYRNKIRKIFKDEFQEQNRSYSNGKIFKK